MSTRASAPIETKVTWASSAATLLVFLGDAIANAARNATDKGIVIPGLPDWLEPIVLSVLIGLPTFLAGYRARHTPRADLGSTGSVGSVA